MDNSTLTATQSMLQVVWTESTFQFSPGFLIFQKVSHGIIAVLTIVGNLWCCFVIRRARDFRKATKIFLLSLTISDLFLGICVTIPSFVLYWGDNFPLEINNQLCSFIGKSHLTLNIISILSLLGVNIERYILVEYPLRAPTIVTTKRAKMYIVLIYIVAALFLTWYLTFPPSHSTVFDKELLHCRVFHDVDDLFTVISFVIIVSIFIIIPFLILTAVYARICWIIHRYNQRAVEISNAHSMLPDHQVNQVVCQKDAKAFVTFLIVTISFVIGWAPIVSLLFYTIFTGKEAPPYLESTVLILLLSNYWWNIIIYITRDQSFRNASLDIIVSCKLFPCTNKYQLTPNKSIHGRLRRVNTSEINMGRIEPVY